VQLGLAAGLLGCLGGRVSVHPQASTPRLYDRPQLHRDPHLEPALYAQECSNRIRTALSHLREAKDKRKTPGLQGTASSWHAGP
jgi:hypothetical protein